MNKPPNADGDETRSGFRSGEGADSVMRHLMAAARRMQKRKAQAPDSRGPASDAGDSEASVDIPLPP